ncbi:glycosyltransferase family 2 protein [Palleronia rufa]|uniref:glycosyltransferase family 2 protein n=1 Tax=Palleronia rufa TaxID=1530186 RepID=UPI00068F2678|nr:glycosyltransferase family 2 protein [Palleronia rufa]
MLLDSKIADWPAHIGRIDGPCARMGHDPPSLPDPAAIRQLGAPFCARHRVLPLRAAGALTPVATSCAAGFAQLRPLLERKLGRPVAPVHVADGRIDSGLTLYAGLPLARAGETRCPEADSCRRPSRRILRLWGVAAAVLALSAAAPTVAVIGLFALALGIAACNAGLLVVAMVFARRRPVARGGKRLADAALPTVSLLIPLYREGDIASLLVTRIARLDYPRDRLDICLIVESGDRVTLDALTRAARPDWVRVIQVAPGQIQTKPRAMNVALDFCQGEVVGIYDAEDAPAPDQLRRVAERFAVSPPDVACLQGRLSFYNARATWLTRCFTMDYATWFWLVLPALRRLGWPVPLGGTTVFFRRRALEAVGGWDAHNVTEDADLGLRLARRGYVTDLIDSVTMEEATTTIPTWLRQRSRWQKGYAITWATHMRDPGALLRDLGPTGFVGVQVLFLGSLLGALTAPVLWSMWLLLLGLPHPLASVLGPVGFLSLGAALTVSLAIHLAAAALALSRQGRSGLILWTPLLQIYHTLATVSLVKALSEVMSKPFFWDKTPHGLSPPDRTFSDASNRG